MMTLARFMRVRHALLPAKRGRLVQLHVKGSGDVLVQWEGRKWPRGVHPTRIELDPEYAEHNTSLLEKGA